MKYLVTGATGFVGSELLAQLASGGRQIRILRRATSRLDLLGDLADAVEHVEGDLTDPVAVAEAVDGVSHIYHTAAHISFQGKKSEEKLWDINVGGTANIVNAALKSGVSRMVLTSSMAAFGRVERMEHLIDESNEWHPSRANSAYARSKHEAELAVYRGIAEGLDAVIVNPSLVFGPGRAGENTMKIVEKVRSRTLPAIPAGGTNVVDVRDVAHGHILAMEKGRMGERYFLGSQNLLWRDIIGILAEAFDVEPPSLILPYVPAMTAAIISEFAAALTRTRPLLTRETARTSSHFYRYDNRKAGEELGCTFRPFRETAKYLAAKL